MRLIFDHNRKINLVSRETSFESLFRIAADCLVPFEFMLPPSGRIFDIGPGGGFPSMVLMLTFPGIEGVLFERTKKKAAFLRRMLRLFDLTGEVVDRDFAEAVRGLEPSSFDYGFLKLVTPDRKLVSPAMTLLRSSGRFVYFGDFHSSGIGPAGDFEAARFEYYLDDSEQLRCLSVFSKRG